MKITLNDLAILGHEPAFKEPLHVGRPVESDRPRFLARINEILDRRWLTNDGPCVLELEKQLCRFLGVRHCILTCNGTVALEIAIRALDMRGEVILPSMTFVATAHALQWLGITPVFCDIDRGTHNLDPLRLPELITPRTSGILCVHLWGRPCNPEVFEEIADSYSLKLVYDAAHAFGTSFKGRMVGTFGDAEVFSFHATKFFNTLEGGAITTNNDAMAARMRMMRNFGFAGYDQVVSLGINGKMNEISAAMGLTLMDDIQELIATNRKQYKKYRQELSGIPGLSLISYDESECANYQYLVLEIDEAITNLSRDSLMQVLWAENVLARRYFYPGCHRMEPYCSFYPEIGERLLETENLISCVLCLPTAAAVTEDNIGEICQIIRLSIANGAEIQSRITSRR